MDFVVLTNDNLVPTDENDGQLRGLLVNKHILRLSSPVFRKMLADDSPFRESTSRTTNRDGIQVVRFEDDDMATMEILGWWRDGKACTIVMVLNLIKSIL